MKQRGFTLSELMFVVAVAAILAAIALPSYQEQVRKGRRADAWAAMNEISQMLERFYTLNNTYAGFELGTNNRSPRAGDVIFYDIALNATNMTYSISATPRQEDRCGMLILNNLGARSSLVTGENGAGSGADDCAR